MKHIFWYIAIPVFVLFTSCNKDDDNTPKDENTIITIQETESYSKDYTVELYAFDTLFEGYNKVYYKIKKKDGSYLSEATLTQNPMMYMMAKSHTTPCENPSKNVNDDNYFEGAIMFVMPSNPSEGWKIHLAIEDGTIKDTFDITVPKVKALDEPKKIVFMDPNNDTKPYFVSIVEPSNPKIGINDFEITIHTKESMMSFPKVEDLTIIMEPEMPSMDHGSPNNVNPVYTENGHYKGSVNFTMSGWWRVNLTILQGQDTLTTSAYFDITF